jgi:acetoin utilization deacetylase AcuC-like enzyme
MRIWHNPSHRAHAGRMEMYRGRLVPCHETPARLDDVLAEVKRRNLGEMIAPALVTRADLERVHSARYLDFLQDAWSEWIALDPANAALDVLPSVWPVRGFRADVTPANFAARVGLYSFDAGTPLTAGTWQAAHAGASCAIEAARALVAARGAQAAAALTRPPGHHAGADFFGGYCFLNNAALAAQALRDGGAARAAVLDVDYHHGNGTQSLFYARADALVVALGVDTFEGDPIAGFRLRSADYLRVGAAIAALGLPTVFVMEGGYAVAEIGVNVANVLEGFES